MINAFFPKRRRCFCLFVRLRRSAFAKVPVPEKFFPENSRLIFRRRLRALREQPQQVVRLQRTGEIVALYHVHVPAAQQLHLLLRLHALRDDAVAEAAEGRDDALVEEGGLLSVQIWNRSERSSLMTEKAAA